VSASGGNALHGEVLEFNRSRGTGAKPYFFGAASAAPARPPTSAMSTVETSVGRSTFRTSTTVKTALSFSPVTKGSISHSQIRSPAPNPRLPSAMATSVAFSPAVAARLPRRQTR
jgi:hypothetical protein